MGKTVEQKSWLSAIADASKECGLALPSFTAKGMGTARTANVAGGRFATFKRRLVSAEAAENDGVEWTLWLEEHDIPAPIAAFRQPIKPRPDDVATTLGYLKGWLLDRWTADEARANVQAHPRWVAT